MGTGGAHSIDKHAQVDAFAKNAGLGFAIPYMHNGQLHDYMPDFIIRLKGEPPIHLILETKGFDELAEVKSQAARRWTSAVNAEGGYGLWKYAVARKPEEVSKIIDEAVVKTNPSCKSVLTIHQLLCFLCSFFKNA